MNLQIAVALWAQREGGKLNRRRRRGRQLSWPVYVPPGLKIQDVIHKELWSLEVT